LVLLKFREVVNIENVKKLLIVEHIIHKTKAMIALWFMPPRITKKVNTKHDSKAVRPLTVCAIEFQGFGGAFVGGTILIVGVAIIVPL